MILSNKQSFSNYFIVIVLVFYACSVGGNLSAQSIFKSVSAFPYEDTVQTFIYFPSGDTTVYNNLFKKLDKLVFEGEGNVNILHIGGSHIQAGTLSHQIRTNLLSTFPGLVGSRGMIFPFSVAKTNGPNNYRTTYTGTWELSKNTYKKPEFPLGLTGICVATSDTEATIDLRLRNLDNISYDFNQVYVLGNCQLNNIRVMLQTHDTVIIEGMYDSDKLSYHFPLNTYTESFRLFFERKDTTIEDTFFLRGFYLDNNLPGISYTAIGINGANVSSYLKCTYLENDLSFINPDLCIFSIGINDASGVDFDTVLFQRNYKELIRRIRNNYPNCAILFTTNNDSFRKVGKKYYNNTNGLLAQQAFHSLAAYYNSGVWDLFYFMGGLNSIKKWEEKGLAQKDKIHFTASGYSLIGDLIYNAFISEYIKYLKNNHLHGLE